MTTVHITSKSTGLSYIVNGFVIPGRRLFATSLGGKLC